MLQRGSGDLQDLKLLHFFNSFEEVGTIHWLLKDGFAKINKFTPKIDMKDNRYVS